MKRNKPVSREACREAVIEVLSVDLIDLATDELISVAEAARELGKTPRAVQMYIKEGRIKARRVGGVNVIRLRDLEDVEDVPLGRPKKK